MPIIRIVTLLLGLIALSACSKIHYQNGYAAEDAPIDFEVLHLGQVVPMPYYAFASHGSDVAGWVAAEEALDPPTEGEKETSVLVERHFRETFPGQAANELGLSNVSVTTDPNAESQARIDIYHLWTNALLMQGIMIYLCVVDEEGKTIFQSMEQYAATLLDTALGGKEFYVRHTMDLAMNKLFTSWKTIKKKRSAEGSNGLTLIAQPAPAPRLERLSD